MVKVNGSRICGAVPPPSTLLLHGVLAAVLLHEPCNKWEKSHL